MVEDLAQTTDIAPTILRLLDITDDTAQMQGRALLDGGRATAGPAFTVSERFRPNLSVLQQRFPNFDARFLDVRTKAIRTRREKFIWRSDEANEFYDLAVDPGETHQPDRARLQSAPMRCGGSCSIGWPRSRSSKRTSPPPQSMTSCGGRLQGLGYLD